MKIKNNLMLLICKDMNGEPPAEIQVIPSGFHKTPKGDFICDAESVVSVLNAFNATANDMVIDYEHQSLESGAAPAAGWIKKLINKGTEGIWAVVDWTEKARQFIVNKEYRYVSPVFLKRVSDGKVLSLLNVALTNMPNIDGMVPLINKLSVGSYQQATKEEPMYKELAKLLGLSETVTEADVIAAINKLNLKVSAAEQATAQIVANKAVLEALGCKEGDSLSAVTGTIMAMKQGATSLEGLQLQVNKLTEELRKREKVDIDAMVNKGIEDGKITPAQKDSMLSYAQKDLEGFKVFIGKAPVVVPTEKVAGDEKGGADAVDAVQIQVNKLMGIDTETFKKFNPKKEG